MNPLSIFLGLLLMGIGLAMFLPAYRLQQAIARPFPKHFSKILRKNIPHYLKMPADLQLQLKRLIRQFLHEKKFIGCDGFIITDEVKVTIAGKASLLLLNRPSLVYPDLKMILVYPSAFIVPRIEMGSGGVVTHSNQTLSGESWSDGRVILAWDHIQQNKSNLPDGHDVVLHEFAHQLDSESGRTNGAPQMSTAHYRHWSEVLSAEFALLQQAADHQVKSALDYYGATSPAEFFAVATETFFQKTEQMARYHPALFEQFRAYYQVDPRDWN
ncbi:MAG: zinc-dependent peptidase [Undibacterium sp.]|uniref:M90 family metallopeptidase n=1 Tax=Undibacterium sp. TaxID=1914977 RepID=UPI0027239BA8|nr:M90 family metallopeptidase [Undibacterium sp.]MDO8651183.1 zinc-dependent peptidase [Undibacterium sp.]